jgi:hypothetical protein
LTSVFKSAPRAWRSDLGDALHSARMEEDGWPQLSWSARPALTSGLSQMGGHPPIDRDEQMKRMRLRM